MNCKKFIFRKLIYLVLLMSKIIVFLLIIGTSLPVNTNGIYLLINKQLTRPSHVEFFLISKINICLVITESETDSSFPSFDEFF